MYEVGDEVLGLAEWLPSLGLFRLRNEVGMGVACSTLILSMRNGKYAGHLKWDIMRKFFIACRRVPQIKCDRLLVETDFFSV